MAATQLSASQSPAGPQAAAEALQAASDAARRQVAQFEQDFYEKKIFDPYLRFASPDDEEAYRKREAERHAEIKAANDKGTPQGSLEASRLALDQLNDAGAHGADRSPDYQPKLDAMRSARAQLAAATEKQSPATAAPPADPLDAASGNVALPADLVAGFRATGTSVADPGQPTAIAAISTAKSSGVVLRG